MIDYEIKIYNETIGDLNSDGIDCQLCKNKGYVMKLIDGYKTLVPCECMGRRISQSLIRKSGFGKLLELYTMERYTTEFDWQSSIKDAAIQYAANGFRKAWFFIGGQVGSGKTHISTAIVSVIIDHGIEARYMLWRDDLSKLKAKTFEDGSPDYMYQWKTVPVLYIDDFFKSDSKPTVWEINTTFEILNYRYNNHLATIISSEYDIQVILSIDEATGSRIVQLTGQKYCINIAQDITRNIRLRRRGEVSLGKVRLGESSAPTPARDDSQIGSFGKLQNVFLTEHELDLLKNAISDYEKRIDKFSLYLKSSGKTYDSHFATIMKFYMEDE